MTRDDITRAIVQELKAGHLADIGGAVDLGFAAPLVESRLTERIAPLRPWQERAGVEPLDENDLPTEIRKMFQHLFDLLQTPVKANS